VAVMDQALINTIISLAAGAYGLVLKSMWDTIKNLDDQVGTLQVSVAGEYLKREEWKDDMRRLMEKLDSIDEKLDKKADK